jgi:hypothetical protein
LNGTAAGGVRVRIADCEVEFRDARILTAVCAATAVVAILKLAVVAPELTVTVPGTVAAPLLLDRVTGVPAVGAADRVTVPCAPVPPTTVLGLTAMAATVGVAEGCVPPPPPPPPFPLESESEHEATAAHITAAIRLRNSRRRSRVMVMACLLNGRSTKKRKT